MPLDMTRGLHWIGHPASLGWIVDRGEESVEPQIDVRQGTSMGGGIRVRESRTRPSRAWSFTIPDSHADEVAHVESLIYGALGPYQLVTSRAQVSNALTPDRSLLRSTIAGSVSRGGGWPKEDGAWTTFSGANPSAGGGAIGLVRVGPCPIPPIRTARPVTVSAWLGTARAAGARVILEWLDAAGSLLSGGISGNLVTGMDVLRRSTATGTPPWGAVSCRIAVQYAEVLAQPQITWTAAPIPEWSVGQGADRVTITGWSAATSMSVPDDYNLRRSDHTLTLIEPGPTQ